MVNVGLSALVVLPAGLALWVAAGHAWRGDWRRAATYALVPVAGSVCFVVAALAFRR